MRAGKMVVCLVEWKVEKTVERWVEQSVGSKGD